MMPRCGRFGWRARRGLLLAYDGFPSDGLGVWRALPAPAKGPLALWTPLTLRRGYDRAIYSPASFSMAWAKIFTLRMNFSQSI